MDSAAVGGLAAAVGAGFCFDGAVALYALEARRMPSSLGLRPSLLRRLARRPRWLAAVGLDIAGWPLQIFALTLAPLTVVQPALALGLLLLLALGRWTLGEPVGRRELLATLAIVGGVAAIALAAPARSEQHLGGIGLALVLTGLGAFALAPYAARGRAPGWLLMLGSGCAYAWTALSSKIVADELSAGRWGWALIWGALTGLLALAGILGELTALQRLAATRVAPVIFVVQTVVPVLLAPVVGHEHWGDTPLGGLVIIAALATVAAGTVLLGSSPAAGGLIESDFEH